MPNRIQLYVKTENNWQTQRSCNIFLLIAQTEKKMMTELDCISLIGKNIFQYWFLQKVDAVIVINSFFSNNCELYEVSGR